MLRDENGITYARMALIMCDLALNTNSLWEEQQLTPKLQSILRRHRQHFDGEPVNPPDHALPSSRASGYNFGCDSKIVQNISVWHHLRFVFN